MKLSDYVMQRIAAEGVKHVFFVPGGAAMHLNDSLGNTPGLEFVANLHEQASAIAAEAYSKVTNNLGVAMVTAGPGGTNAITGVAGAWLDSTACIVFSGQVKRADLKGDSGVRQVGVQEVDITAIVAPITKYAVTVLDPETIRFHLEKALFLARSGRPGPVWLDLPLDVQAAQIDPDSLRGFTPAATPVGQAEKLREAVRDTIALLDQSRRPALLVGNGVRLAGARDELRVLVERLGIPVLTTWLALDMIPDAHPLFAGRPGAVAPRGANFTVQNCDFLLSLGARLDNVLCGYAQERFAPLARKIMVDIDPAEIRKMKTRIDVAAPFDAGDFIRELLNQIENRSPVATEAWLARVREWRRRYPVVLPQHLEGSGRVSIYALADALSEELDENVTIVNGSSGSGIELFLHAFRTKEGQRFLHTTALGGMGFAVPMAIGACLAGDRQPVPVVDGDGGFQFNVQELETIRRLDLPIKFFVLENEGYASIRASQKNYFGRLVAADATSGLTLPRLDRVAAAWKLPFRRISDQRDLRSNIRSVLEAKGPLVCEVDVIPDEDRLPRIYSAIQANGSMISSPLEDLYPTLSREELAENMAIDIVSARG